MMTFPSNGISQIETQPTLLIIEDDQDVADMLDTYFHVQGYQVVTVNFGEDGLGVCQNSTPDLVILDVRLPDIDGFEVARRLRIARRTQDIPIIFLTQLDDRSNRLRGLELHAEDYIPKPFDVHELRLRVRNALRRNRQGSLTNPITGLAEGALVEERLGECLGAENWGMLVVSLRNLDPFRDLYGFVAADEVLRAVVQLLQDTLHEEGGPNDFLGHLTQTDFILITESAYLVGLADLIQKRLEPALIYYYREKDCLSQKEAGRLLSVQIARSVPSQEKYQRMEQLKAHIMSLRQ